MNIFCKMIYHVIIYSEVNFAAKDGSWFDSLHNIHITSIHSDIETGDVWCPELLMHQLREARQQAAFRGAHWTFSCLWVDCGFFSLFFYFLFLVYCLVRNVMRQVLPWVAGSRVRPINKQYMLRDILWKTILTWGRMWVAVCAGWDERFSLGDTLNKNYYCCALKSANVTVGQDIEDSFIAYIRPDTCCRTNLSDNVLGCKF